jgi:site-specific DNA-methyltransferase (adenine-specific)
MTFDVIIGNPPYQMNDGGGTGSSAMPLYDKFVLQAMKLQPKYLSMIIPARWYAGGKGLDEFRNTTLNDNRISHLVDYFDSTECFPGVDISGGVCYFLWNKDYHGDCIIESKRGKNITTLKRPLLEEGNDSFVRFNEAINIWHKIKNKGFKSFVNYVSSRKPFGDFYNIKDNQTKNSVLIYAYPHNGYVENNQILQNKEWVGKYKVFIAKAYGERGEFPYLVLGKPFLGDKNTCCTETYLVLNPCSTKEEAENVISYIKTRFFRFFVLFKKNTQNREQNGGACIERTRKIKKF